jgi:hypothetical protein
MSPIYNDLPNKIIIDSSDENKIIIEDQSNRIVVSTIGVQGATGPQGIQGVPGTTNIHAPVVAATTAATGGTYAAGTLGADGGYGVGATITAASNGQILVDSYSPLVGDRVLYWKNTDARTNGIYVVTNVGSGSTKWVLTRASDYDNHIDGQITQNDQVLVLRGTQNANKTFAMVTRGTGTNGEVKVGTDTIDWVQISSLVNVNTDIIPSVDNLYTLGDATHRWKNIWVGPGTINITDSITGNNAGITVSDGVFFIDGIAQAQLPNVKLTNLIFNDNTTQTTAAVAQVNSDWNATSGKAQILNKPTIPTASDPTPTAYSPVFSSSGGLSQIAFTGTPATGSYMKQGKLVHFRIKVLYTTMTAFGSGNGNQYFLTLPFAPAEKYVFRDAMYEKASNSGHYELSAHATAGSTTMALHHSAGGGNEVPMNHSAPTAPSTADYFYISGTYEAQ